MTVEEITEKAKASIGYERHVTLFGKAAADNVLCHWIFGYQSAKTAQAETLKELLELSDRMNIYEEAVEKMKKFMRHHPDCPNVNGFVNSCTCGFKKLLSTLLNDTTKG